MFCRSFFVFLSLFFLFPIGDCQSFETRGQDCSRCHNLSHDEAAHLLRDLYPSIKIIGLRVSPSKGFWEIFLESGGRRGLIYVDFSKKYLISGRMLSIKERRDLTQESADELIRADVSQIPLDDALVMGDQKARIRVIVFHDPD
jgi:thiol:disulfide interchange protein DsbC